MFTLKIKVFLYNIDRGFSKQIGKTGGAGRADKAIKLHQQEGQHNVYRSNACTHHGAELMLIHCVQHIQACILDQRNGDR